MKDNPATTCLPYYLEKYCPLEVEFNLSLLPSCPYCGSWRIRLPKCWVLFLSCTRMMLLDHLVKLVFQVLLPKQMEDEIHTTCMKGLILCHLTRNMLIVNNITS